MAISVENDDLVVRAQAGDRRAFDSLVVLHRGRLIRLISRYTHNPWDAEDIVQDTFIRAYRSLRNFRHESKFYTWVVRIALNVAKNKHSRSNARRLKFMKYVEPAGHENEPFDIYLLDSCDLDSPEEVLMGQQLAQAISLAFEELSLESKTAYLLREVECLTYAQIATKMVCPIGTVRSRIARARKTIVELFIDADGKPLFPSDFLDEDTGRHADEFQPDEAVVEL